MEEQGNSEGLSPEKQTFLLHEFDALRKEIEIEIKQLRDYMQAAILASGAIWAWLLSHKDLAQVRWAGVVPLFLSVLLSIQTTGLRGKIFKIGSYIADLEDALHLPAKLGWERHLKSGKIKRDGIPRLEAIIWITLCVGNLVGAIYFYKVFENAPIH